MRRPARKKAAPSPAAASGDQPEPAPAGANRHDFAAAQAMFAAAIMRPMTSGQHMQHTWIDGRSMKEVAAELIKPSARMSSYERLEIYNRQYWFRLVDCMYEDFPGLLAVIGQKKFDALITEYLVRYPSTSFTLRNLGSRLVEFIEAEPKWTYPRNRMALDMARIEWAWIVAFDGEFNPPLTRDDIQGRNPETLTLQLQPYVTLLELNYPLDDFLISLNKVQHLRTEAGTGSHHHSPRRSRVRLPQPEKVLLAVHRCDNTVYYKRLEPEEFAILMGIRLRRSVADSCALAICTDKAGLSVEELSARITNWFATWTELGWLCPSPEP